MRKQELKKKIPYMIYIVLFLAVSLIPLILLSDKQGTIGNETKADPPKLSSGTGFFGQAEDYFAQNFGLRNRLVYAGNSIKQAVFKTSGQSEVIIGEDGWLFYESALKDYVGTERLSGLQLEKIAVILKMVSDYAAEWDRDFIFFSAPNKMSIYGEYMPYYYLETKEQGNYEGLYKRLTEMGICTVNLKNVLSLAKLDGVQLYHKLDSHWNNYGAAAAYEAVARTLAAYYSGEGYDGFRSYTGLPWHIAVNFSGDLQSMLLPGSKVKDEQIEFETEEYFEYTSRFRGGDDLLITTVNSHASVDKSVTLFRDSFGDALYWFFADEYEALSAKREVPYNIYQAVQESELIAVELVERNLANLLIYTPIVPSGNLGEEFLERIAGSLETAPALDLTLHISMNAEGLQEIVGICPELDDWAWMYLAYEAGTGTAVYQLLPCEGDGAFRLYLTPEEAREFEGEWCIIVENEGSYKKIPANVTLQD